MIITENAAIELKKIMTNQRMSTNIFAIKIGTIQEQNGLKYSINFEPIENEIDESILIKTKDVTIKIDKKSKIYLENTTIDFYKNDQKSGFVFLNS